MQVPLHFVDEDKCVGVKVGGGNITHNLTEVEVACLPANLPEYIEVYMAEVEAGVSVHLSDLALPEGVRIVALSYGEDRDIPVVSVKLPRGGAQADEADEVAGEEAASEGDDAGDAEGEAEG